MEKQELMEVMRFALEDWFGSKQAEIAPKWKGGKLVMHSARGDLQPKEVEIDVLFHKIVMIRESLRVLEQKLNSHPNLDDADRVQLQQYITRIYGTLTTFNVLFKDENDRFTGQKGER